MHTTTPTPPDRRSYPLAAGASVASEVFQLRMNHPHVFFDREIRTQRQLLEDAAYAVPDRFVGIPVMLHLLPVHIQRALVIFEDTGKNSARLSLQVKRSLTISDARTNTDFREVIRDIIGHALCNERSARRRIEATYQKKKPPHERVSGYPGRAEPSISQVPPRPPTLRAQAVQAAESSQHEDSSS